MSATGTGLTQISNVNLAAGGAAGSQINFTHNLGVRAIQVYCSDAVTGRQLDGTEISVAQPTANVVQVANVTTGAVVVNVSIRWQYDSVEENAVASTDARIAPAVGPPPVATGIVGGGAANQITYWTGAAAISGNAFLTTDPATGDLDRIKNVPYDWPAANAVGVLTNDGAGNLTWTPAGAAGANTALSNLAAVAVNAALNPGADNTIGVGTSALRWSQMNAGFFTARADATDTVKTTYEPSQILTAAAAGTFSIDALTNNNSLTMFADTGVIVGAATGPVQISGVGTPAVQLSGSGSTDTIIVDQTNYLIVDGSRGMRVQSAQGAVNGGTAAIPSLAIGLATTTGLYQAAANELGFTNNGVETMLLTADNALEINASAAAVSAAAKGRFRFNVAAGNVMQFSNNGGAYQTIMGATASLVAGRVTLSASATTITDNANLTFNGTVLAVNQDGTVALPSITLGTVADPDTGVFHPAPNELALSTGASERARFRLVNTGASTGRVEFQLGTMSAVAGEYGLYTRATGLNSATNQFMNLFEGVGAGANTGEQHVFSASLTAGYTGASRSSAVYAINASATTATAAGAWGNIQGTLGIYSQASGTYTGHAFAVVGNALGGAVTSTNVGVFGRSSSTFANTHVGVAGVALSSVGGGVQVGGFFGVGDYGVTAPTWASGAVVGDVGAGAGIPIFRGRNAGVDRFRVMETGVVQIYSTGAINAPVLTFGPNAGPADTTTGIWRPGSNVLSFVNSGANTLYLAADNKVGVGTANSQSRLGVAGNVAIGATYADTVGSPTNGLAVEGSVGVGIITPTAQLQLAGGVTGSSGFHVFWAGSLGSDNNSRAGLRYTLTTAGTGASAHRIGIQSVLGGTSTDASAFVYGIVSDLSVPGVSNNLRLSTSTGAPLGNVGTVTYAYGTTVGLNVGSYAEAANGNFNVGVLAKTITAKNSATNVGVLAVALNTGSSPVQVAGYFGLVTATPTLTSAALIADNGATTSNIFEARDNGTAAVTVADGGAVTMTGNETVSGRRLGASAAIVAANDLTLGVTNLNIVSGNTQINALTTAGWTAGSQVTLVFSGTPTVKHNTAGGAGTAVMLLAGSVDLVAAANTVLSLVYDGTAWQETSRKVA